MSTLGRPRGPKADPRFTDPVVWILGAGFSKPLGGPLFVELLEPGMGQWVSAWLKWRQLEPVHIPVTALKIYTQGQGKGMWTNAEECLAVLDEARSDKLTQARLGLALGISSAEEANKYRILLTQFIAIATSFFVDQAHELRSLPEVWSPFEGWMNSLRPADTILSFNYDLVVEEVAARAGKTINLVKLHGSVPAFDVLPSLIRDGRGIDSISTPGPAKVLAARGALAKDWQRAEVALAAAKRLVIVGYSFPPSDSTTRSLVLKHSAAEEICVVVGTGQAGAAIEDMFVRRIGRRGVVNTRLLTEQFLAEGSATLRHGRFDHWLFSEPA